MKHLIAFIIGILMTSVALNTTSIKYIRDFLNPPVKHHIVKGITEFEDNRTNRNVLGSYRIKFKNDETKQVGEFDPGSAELEVFEDLPKGEKGYYEYDDNGWKRFNHKLHLPEKD